MPLWSNNSRTVSVLPKREAKINAVKLNIFN